MMKDYKSKAKIIKRLFEVVRLCCFLILLDVLVPNAQVKGFVNVSGPWRHAEADVLCIFLSKTTDKAGIILMLSGSRSQMVVVGINISLDIGTISLKGSVTFIPLVCFEVRLPFLTYGCVFSSMRTASQFVLSCSSRCQIA